MEPKLLLALRAPRPRSPRTTTHLRQACAPERRYAGSKRQDFFLLFGQAKQTDMTLPPPRLRATRKTMESRGASVAASFGGMIEDECRNNPIRVSFRLSVSTATP